MKKFSIVFLIFMLLLVGCSKEEHYMSNVKVIDIDKGNSLQAPIVVTLSSNGNEFKLRSNYELSQVLVKGTNYNIYYSGVDLLSVELWTESEELK